VRKWFGTRPAESITSAEVEAALQRAKREHGWNASSGVERETEDNSRVRYLRPEEERKLREAIRSNTAWLEHEPELTLALSTGLRRRSMYRDLVWENIDLEARVATVPRPKNGEPVHVPPNTDAVKALMIFRLRGTGREGSCPARRGSR